MTRKPALWVTLAVVGLLGVITAVRLFPLAFPLLAVDAQMDREAALQGALDLAQRP